MMEIHLDRSDPEALHVQVAAEIRKAIAGGEAKPGERLPSALDFATYLEVNRNTVLRAFRLLRDEGLLELTKGRGGVKVVGTPERGKVLTRVQDLLTFAGGFGYRQQDVIEMIQSQG
jgi:DNA-binding transcriptional regulator YhcF (GntR family)